MWLFNPRERLKMKVVQTLLLRTECRRPRYSGRDEDNATRRVSIGEILRVERNNGDGVVRWHCHIAAPFPPKQA